MKTKILPSVAVRAVFTAFFFIAMLCFVNGAKAQPQLTFKRIAQNLSKPLEIKNAGDGSGRLFIIEQGGIIKIYKPGGILNKIMA